jgi:CRP-like cAMP-binding protein
MRKHLKSFAMLTNDEIDLFESKVIRKTLKKGDYFIKEGRTSKEVAFIVSGLFYYSSYKE